MSAASAADGLALSAVAVPPRATYQESRRSYARRRAHARMPPIVLSDRPRPTLLQRTAAEGVGTLFLLATVVGSGIAERLAAGL